MNALPALRIAFFILFRASRNADQEELSSGVLRLLHTLFLTCSTKLIVGVEKLKL